MIFYEDQLLMSTKCILCYGCRGGLVRVCTRCNVHFHPSCWWEWFFRQYVSMRRSDRESVPCVTCVQCKQVDRIKVDHILPSSRVKRNQSFDRHQASLLLAILQAGGPHEGFLLPKPIRKQYFLTFIQYVDEYATMFFKQHPLQFMQILGQVEGAMQLAKDQRNKPLLQELTRIEGNMVTVMLQKVDVENEE